MSLVEQLTIFDILDEPKNDSELSNYEIDLFTEKLKRMVLEAVNFLGYEKSFDGSTEISVSSVVTSTNNKYIPKGCAIIDVYLLSNKATGHLKLANQFALQNNFEWVEYRNYDHRYFKKWNHCCMPNEVRDEPNIYSIEHYRGIHYRGKIGDIWFGNTGRSEYSIQRIKDFIEWKF